MEVTDEGAGLSYGFHGYWTDLIWLSLDKFWHKEDYKIW
jgi:hypothetical protein